MRHASLPPVTLFSSSRVPQGGMSDSKTDATTPAGLSAGSTDLLCAGAAFGRPRLPSGAFGAAQAPLGKRGLPRAVRRSGWPPETVAAPESAVLAVARRRRLGGGPVLTRRAGGLISPP